MRGFMKRATRTRGRRVVTLAAVMVMLSSSAALAWYVESFSGVQSSVAPIAAANSGGSTFNGGNAVSVGANWGPSCTGAAGATNVALAPGVTDTLCLTATDLDTVNSAKTYTTQLTSITPTVDSAHATAGCSAAWFTVAPSTNDLASQPVNFGQVNASYGNKLGTITFNDSGTNQSSCEGAQIGLTVAGTAS